MYGFLQGICNDPKRKFRVRKSHKTIDTAVDRLYQKTSFGSERERVEHLFGLYEKMVDPDA